LPKSYKMKKIYLILFFFLLPLIGAASACSAEENKTPSRIICLAPSFEQSLRELGEEERIIATVTTGFNKKPAREIVGDLQSIDFEKILLLKPELILAKDDCTRPETLEKLKSFGLNVASFPGDRDFDDICANFLELAKILGKEEKAGQVLEKIKKEVRGLEEKAKATAKKTVFLQVGIMPVVTAGSRSYLHFLLTAAGGENIFKDMEEPYFLVSREEVVKRDPMMIIFISEMEDSQGAKELWGAFPGMAAVKNNRIFAIDADTFCQPTPGRFIESLKMLNAMISENDENKK
jgi:ABC-type Fe3+-hydroxamate transport system substrate-binding protein